MRIFSEVGISPHGLVSTEYESSDSEYRVNRFVLGSYVSVYLRVRCMGTEVILDSVEWVKVKRNKPGFRLVIGVQSK